MKVWKASLVLIAGLLVFPAMQGWAEWDDFLPLELGPLTVGGALRYNYVYKDWDPDYKGSGQFEFDTYRVDLQLEHENLIGSLQYRYYRYPHVHHEYSMLHHGWIGYRSEQGSELQIGVHQVPFGLLPYASNNYFFQLPYYVGLEDDYDLGVKYIFDTGPWNWQLAYYLCDEGSWSGKSADSARYSYDPVQEDGAGNVERNQFNLRLTRTYSYCQSVTTEVGVSLQIGEIPNRISNRTGHHYAGAVHSKTSFGRWKLMLEALSYKYSLKNPPGVSGDYVVMGAYDYGYQVASKANIYLVGLSYTIPINGRYIDEITFYDDFSFMDKSRSDWLDTYQNVIGASISAGRLFVYVDFAAGRNNPWLGPGWTSSLSQGGQFENGWDTRFNVNIGYYF